MASICRDPGGRKRILFVDADGNRRAIFLGKMTKQRAVAVKIKVEALVGAKLTRGTVEDEVSRWMPSSKPHRGRSTASSDTESPVPISGRRFAGSLSGLA